MEIQFGDFAIDLARQELQRGGKRVPVEPQVFDLLVHLARNHNRVVSKNEVIDVVWKGRIVSEAAVSSRVSAARHAVGDNGTRTRKSSVPITNEAFASSEHSGSLRRKRCRHAR